MSDLTVGRITFAPTAGPWTVGVGIVAEFGEECLAVGILGNPWKPIAALSLASDVNDTDKANALLIAAAPDLLAALKECSFRLAALIAASGDFSEANGKACDLARAAIAKAEGR